MDQSIITAICGLILIAALAASYVAHKKNGDDAEASASNLSVTETMREVSEYFGVEAQPKDSVSKAFDLAPLQMASALTDQTKPAQTKKSKKKRRR